MPALKPCLGYTSRTAAIASMRAEDLPTRDIADRIGIEPKTVTALEASARRDRSQPSKGKGGCRLLDEQQLDEMCAMRERGKGIHAIAEHFNKQGIPVTASTIEYQCMRLGADAPVRFRGKTPSKLAPYVRRMGPVRPYSAEDDRRLIELTERGTKHKDVCEALGRSTSSVRGRLLTLARHQARAEDVA